MAPRWRRPCRDAYNNAYRILHYIPATASVRPHQVTYFFRSFYVLSINNLYAFAQQCAYSCNYFYTLTSNV